MTPVITAPLAALPPSIIVAVLCIMQATPHPWWSALLLVVLSATVCGVLCGSLIDGLERA